jgi:hypothetical protein
VFYPSVPHFLLTLAKPDTIIRKNKRFPDHSDFMSQNSMDLVDDHVRVEGISTMHLGRKMGGKFLLTFSCHLLSFGEEE